MLSRNKLQFSLLIFHLTFLSCYGNIFCCENTSILSLSCIWKECNWKARKWCVHVKLGNNIMWIFPNCNNLFPSPQGSQIFENLDEIWRHYSNFNNHYFITPNKNFFAKFPYRANVQIKYSVNFGSFFYWGNSSLNARFWLSKVCRFVDGLFSMHMTMFVPKEIYLNIDLSYMGYLARADLMCLSTTCENVFVIKMITQHKWMYWMHLYNPNC